WGRASTSFSPTARATAGAPAAPAGLRGAPPPDPALLPIFDISARHEVSNLAIVHAVLRHLDRDPEEWVEHVADRPNHDRRYLIDPAKLERELGWKPRIDFESGLAGTVRWYVEHEDWWRTVLAEKGELRVDWSK
ncbi:GDP-mannose 4,6-dehydratase, partial [Actinosynnema sp. NPDC059335]|uniref:GDP-mannose 4,6-dehydratase n=1 Tax=Actinosynnema sp. NPDC059335 TaxID=3346804 RepID=UPI00366EE18D